MAWASDNPHRGKGSFENRSLLGSDENLREQFGSK